MQPLHVSEMLSVTMALLSYTTAILGTMEFEEQTVKIGTGESFTFHTSKKMDEDVLWLYGHLNPHTLIAQIYRTDINTELSERFRDRLQLNVQTGSLTIRNTSAEDSGIYRVEVTGARATRVKIFHFAVYAPVSKPVLSTTPQHQLTNWPSAVLVECSVENGREVTLAWYRGSEFLNETNSLNNITLMLPLVVKQQDNTVYTCVAANPVNNQTVLLSTQELYSQETGSGQDSHPCSAIVVRLVLSALVAIIMAALLVEHFINYESNGKASLTS